MATLEKIRSKSVLLLVIIGAALLAFIIGDFFTSGRTLFGTGTTVAKVGSTKIDIQEFQREMERANAQMQQSGQKVDAAMLQQQVLNGMISQSLYKEELAKLGIVVTNQELTEMLLGSASAAMDRMVQQQFGLESARQLHDIAFNPSKYGIPQEQAQQYQQVWVGLEEQAEQMLLQQKFNALFSGAIVANELDAKAIYNENNSTAHLIYASAPYSSLPDAEFAPTDAEIEKEWSAHKSLYRLDEPMRTINYISVDIAPSQADIVAGEVKVEKAIAALTEKEGIEGIADFTDFVADRQKTPASAIRDARVRSFADSASVGQVKLVSRMGNEFTLAKLFGRTSEVDTINVSMIAVQGGKTTVDSVLTALRGGMKLDSLQQKFAGAVQGAQDSMVISLSAPNMANYKKALSEAATGTYFTPDTASANGAMIFRVNSRNAAISMVDLAVVDYTIEPSAATVNELQAKLQEFLNANKTAAEFEANAQKAGYQAFPTRVSASTPGITGLDDTRDVVAWAMKAKKGQVSPIFGSETTGHFIAAALDDIYKEYIPATDTQVKQALTAKVRNDKKAAELIKRYTGKAKDIAGYAKVMNSKVDSAQVNFGQIGPFNPGFAGAEVAGVVAATPKGKVSAPLKGVTSVVVFQVTDIENGARPYDFKESAVYFNRSRGAQALTQQFNNLLLGNRKVKNNLLKFFQN